MEIANGRAQTLLYQLASVRNEKAVRLLIDGKSTANINAQDTNENPPLYSAARANYATIVHRTGGDRNARDDARQRILHRVARDGSDDAVRLLLEISPEKDARDNDQTPLYIAARYIREGTVHPMKGTRSLWTLLLKGQERKGQPWQKPLHIAVNMRQM
jgi:ankyrin repeat protein